MSLNTYNTSTYSPQWKSPSRTSSIQKKEVQQDEAKNKVTIEYHLPKHTICVLNKMKSITLSPKPKINIFLNKGLNDSSKFEQNTFLKSKDANKKVNQIKVQENILNEKSKNSLSNNSHVTNQNELKIKTK